MRKVIGGLWVMALAAGMMMQVVAQPSAAINGADETAAERAARMAWWREAKFGMFIHWGLYAIPAGEYKGKEASPGEWVQNRGRIPVAEYAGLAGQFNPRQFDADQWVQLAADAGMKYLVVTAKHHDGFALFKSAASPFNVVDATPFKRDVVRELAEACKRHGIRFGVYYSQAQDWHHPGALLWHGPWDPAQVGDTDEYIDKVCVPQLRELLSNYGPISVLWFDTPQFLNPSPLARDKSGITPARAGRIADTLKLQPGLIINDRLGGGIKGDTQTPEQSIPARGYPGRDWETCMTMNNTWGYKKMDHDWKSTATLLRNLIDIASKGGNYLLNVGPTADGVIPEPSIERLRAIGSWMKVNGEAIYGTGPTPFGPEAGSYDPVRKEKNGKPVFNQSWVWRCTTKPSGAVQGKPGKLYIHIFQWPAAGKLELPAVKGTIVKAYLLADPKRSSLNVTRSATGVSVELPSGAPDPIASVLCFELAGK